MKGRRTNFAKIVKWGGLITAAIACFLQVQVASAATPKTALAISPPLFEISANPGDTIKQTIRLDNLTDTNLPVTLSKKDFVALGEEGQATLTDKPTPYSLSTWIALDEKAFTLPARTSKSIHFTIKVPQKAEPGGHFGSIVFHTQPKDSQAGTGVAVGQEIGALLLLRVSGEAKEEASIASFRSTKDIWEEGPIQFETRFQNTGNVQLKPSGAITLSNMFGQKVGSVSIDSRTVLPSSVRKMATAWTDGLWPGWYTASVAIGYGSNGQLLTSTTNFTVFPYKVIIPLVVVLLALLFLIIRARQRIWRSLKILFGKE